jgi:hypothetical protein
MYDDKTAAPKHHARGGAFAALLIVTLLTLATGAAAWSTTGETGGGGGPPDNSGQKVTICHRTASESNPYRTPPVNTAGAANAHMDHIGPIFGQQAPGQKWGDIIEPFTFRGEDFPGLNWTAEGQEIAGNGCALPEPECPAGEVPDGNGGCVPEECPAGEVPDGNGGCVPEECPAGEVPDGNGECVPEGSGGTTPPATGGGPGPGSGGPVVAGESATAAGASAGSVGGTGSGAAAPAVPGTVDAGLAPEASRSSSLLLGAVLVGFGVVLMTAAGLLGPAARRRSAHSA